MRKSGMDRVKYHLAGMTDVLAAIGAQISGVSLNLFGVVTVTLKTPVLPAPAPAPAAPPKAACEKCGRP